VAIHCLFYMQISVLLFVIDVLDDHAVASTSISPVSSVRNLGAHVDSDVTMRTHITSTVRTCFAALRYFLPSSTRRPTIGDRAFPVAASHAWNSLPAALRDTENLLTFRRHLKTYLFNHSFLSCIICVVYSAPALQCLGVKLYFKYCLY
jgi:hypothetical protein